MAPSGDAFTCVTRPMGIRAKIAQLNVLCPASPCRTSLRADRQWLVRLKSSLSRALVAVGYCVSSPFQLQSSIIAIMTLATSADPSTMLARAISEQEAVTCHLEPVPCDCPFGKYTGTAGWLKLLEAIVHYYAPPRWVRWFIGIGLFIHVTVILITRCLEFIIRVLECQSVRQRGGSWADVLAVMSKKKPDLHGLSEDRKREISAQSF
ncbi:hypothetical protein QIS74_10014 [Colletotrichum tabaci]|uniref:Uncharacterized protein n=1 Tax=Colletotrichum tabaci TaxID=1209068 RepID=A0AAV9T2D0_9PEZI